MHMNNAAGRDVANAAVMNSLLLPWPLKNIFWVLSKLETSIHAEVSELKKVQILKLGLMSDLLTVAVPVPEVSAVAPTAKILLQSLDNQTIKEYVPLKLYF